MEQSSSLIGIIILVAIILLIIYAPLAIALIAGIVSYLILFQIISIFWSE